MNTDHITQTSSPDDGEPADTVWIRFQPGHRDQLLDALDVAADWMENDLDCADCPKGTCTDDDHARWMDKVHDWRALASHLDATSQDSHQPEPPPAETDVDVATYIGQRPPLGPVMLDVTTSEPDARGRLVTGQVFGEGRGVFYALNTARRLACRHGTVSVVVTEYRRPDKRVLYRHGVPGKPDVDVTPWCPRCGTKHCSDMSMHYEAIAPYLAAWADTYNAPADAEPDPRPESPPVTPVPAAVNGFPVIAALAASATEARWWVICRRTEPAYATGPQPLYVVWTAWVDTDGVGHGQNGDYGPGHGLTFDQAQQALLDRAGYTHRAPATTAVTREGSIVASTVIQGERIDLWARRRGPGLLEVDLCTAAGFGCGEARFAEGELTLRLPDGWPATDQVRVACLITQIAYFGIARRWEPDPADQPR